MKNVAVIVVLAVTLSPISAQAGSELALAYIDPGSGSAIMSAIIGFVVALGLALKTYAYKIKAFFGGGKSQETEQPSSDDSPGD